MQLILLCLHLLTARVDAFRIPYTKSAFASVASNDLTSRNGHTGLSFTAWSTDLANADSVLSCDGPFVTSWNGDCDRLASDEDARIRLSIALTLCEIEKIAAMRVPAECRTWLESGATRHGPCVEALSRSLQSWSSYIGFARNIVTVCTGLSRWSDAMYIDRMYRNLTGMQNAAMSDVLQRVRMHDEAAADLRRSQLRFQDEVSSVIGNFAVNAEAQAGFLDLQKAALQKFELTAHDLAQRADNAQLRSAAAFEDAMARLPTILETSLASVVPSFETSLVAALQSSSVAYAGEMREIAVQTFKHVAVDLAGRISDIQQVVVEQLRGVALSLSIIGDNLAAHEILSAKLQQDALSLSLVVQQTQVTASNSLEIAQQHAALQAAMYAQQLNATASTLTALATAEERLNALTIPTIWQQLGWPAASAVVPYVLQAVRASPAQTAKGGLAVFTALVVWRQPLFAFPVLWWSTKSAPVYPWRNREVRWWWWAV